VNNWTPDTVDQLSLEEKMREFPGGYSLDYVMEDPRYHLLLTSEPGAGWRCVAIFSDSTVTRDIPFEPTFESVAAAFAYYENSRGRGKALT